MKFIIAGLLDNIVSWLIVFYVEMEWQTDSHGSDHLLIFNGIVYAVLTDNL
jgi:hypothetical protein